MPGFLRRCYGPGWALVGDAGYYKDPITTHGITDGLRDAELLADAIVDALSGRVSDPMAMANYQSARDRMSARLFSATDAVAAYDWDTDQVRTLLRQVSAAMAHELDLLPGFRWAGPTTASSTSPSRYGYAESPDVPAALQIACGMSDELELEMEDTTYFVSTIALRIGDDPGMSRWRKRLFIATAGVAADAADYFALPRDKTITLGSTIEV